MKKITILLVKIFTFLFSTTSWGEWSYVTEDVKGVKNYYDKDRVRKSGKYLYFWELSDYPKPNEYRNLSETSYTQLDCSILLSLFRKQLSHSGKKCDLLELRRLVSEFIQQRLHFQSARSLLRQLRHQLGCAALATALLATLGVAPAYAVSFAAQTGDNNSFNGVDVGTYSVPTFVDIDNDGDIDAFIGEDSGTINYYKNTGSNSSPTFTAQTGGNNPLNGVDVGSASKPSFVDIDNDGDIDVFKGVHHSILLR